MGSIEKDFLPALFLSAGHLPCYLSIIMVGVLFHQRERYLRAALLLLTICVWNALLKQWFRVPLFPHLGDGYAFPSGHMHGAAVFYGYIFLSMKKQAASLFCTFLLTGIALTLIGCHFHDSLDVLGACGFAAIELWLAFSFEHRPHFEPKLLLFVVSCLVLWLITVPESIPGWLWNLVAIFIGLFFRKEKCGLPCWTRCSIVGLYCGFSFLWTPVGTYLNPKKLVLGFLLACLPNLKHGFSSTAKA